MKAQALQHLNICVYEIAIDKDGENHSLMKQVNNAIPVAAVSIRRCMDISYNDLKTLFLAKQVNKVADTAGFNFPLELPKTFWMYPFKEEEADEKINWTVVEGVMVENRKRDEDQMFASVKPDATPEQEYALKCELLKKYQVYVPFMIAVPETKKYMFDVSLSHIPPEAVSEYTEPVPGQPMMEEEVDSLPLGLDPTKPFVSPDDMKKMNNFRNAIETQIAEAVEANNGKLPGDFKIDEDRLRKDAGFDTEEEYLHFRSFFEVPTELAQAMKEEKAEN